MYGGYETQTMKLDKPDCGKDTGTRGTNYGNRACGWPITNAQCLGDS